MENNLKKIIETLDFNKAEDIVYLNVSNLNPLAEYYIICGASSSRQALALANYASKVIEDFGGKINHIEGNANSEWVLLDANDFIVHIFVGNARNKYSLEKMLSENEIYKVE